MCKLYQSSTCAVYRQVVLTAQILLKAGWLARSPALEICELSLAQKKGTPGLRTASSLQFAGQPSTGIGQLAISCKYSSDAPSLKINRANGKNQQLESQKTWLSLFGCVHMLIALSEKSGRELFQRHISKCTYPILHLFLIFIKSTISCTTFWTL